MATFGVNSELGNASDGEISEHASSLVEQQLMELCVSGSNPEHTLRGLPRSNQGSSLKTKGSQVQTLKEVRGKTARMNRNPGTDMWDFLNPDYLPASRTGALFYAI